MEAMTLLGFAVEIYWLQLEAGRHFLHEHPATATSWRERIVLELRRDKRVGEVVGDQCRYGLRTAGMHGDLLPARKPTRFLSSSEAILEQLSLRCQGTHKHQPLLGNRRAGAAAIYPPGLCRAILAGAEDQLRRDRGVAPAAVRQAAAGTGVGLYDLAADDPEEEEASDVKEEEEKDKSGGSSRDHGATHHPTQRLLAARFPQSMTLPSCSREEDVHGLLPEATAAALMDEDEALLEYGLSGNPEYWDDISGAALPPGAV